jgi:nicotinamide mononucleotide adenylyltransferase
MIETGVAEGRFQILHLKHIEYLLAAKMRCRKLYIGITHSDLSYFKGTSELDIHGSKEADNPLTYFERFEMIQEAMEDFGVKREEYEIIPFPVSRPELILQYAPQNATYYMSICSQWDEECNKILQNLGLATEILWRKDEGEIGITGTEVRELITMEKEWEQYVPKTVAEYIKKHEIESRIQHLSFLQA